MDAEPMAHKTYPIIPGAQTGHGPIEPKPSQETVVRLKEVTPAVNQAADGRPASERTMQLVTYTPLAIALLHNWWQWVYLEKTYVYSITDFLLSANFLMWALLLVAGTTLGIYSLKRSGNRTAAIIALVTIAINFILYLVPRR